MDYGLFCSTYLLNLQEEDSRSDIRSTVLGTSAPLSIFPQTAEAKDEKLSPSFAWDAPT
jgi:hypothetical protein